MGEEFQDKDAAGVVMDRGDEAVVISRDIENRDRFRAAYGAKVGARKGIANIDDRLPLRGRGDCQPSGEIGSCFGVLPCIIENTPFW